MKLFIKQITFTISLLFNLAFVHAQEYNILKYGAKPGTNSTTAIQNAIDACEKDGGGIVLVPAGRYTAGTIFIKSNVEFHLNQNAVIEGSLEKKDYKDESLIMCSNIENASISGPGIIDGNGDEAFFQSSNKDRIRPHNLFLKNSKNITVTGVRLVSSAFWSFRILGSENIIVNGISIYNHGNNNNDGIDIDGKNINISNCFFDTEDDAICFKSDRSNPCENVVVTNCNIASDCNPIKMGTASVGGFRNIAISNCVIHRSSQSSPHHKWKTEMNASSDTIGISGVALEIVDGGTMDQITITNLSMTDIQTPIFIRLGNRAGNNKGVVKNILISNINAKTESYLPCSITAYEGYYVDNVILRDIFIQCRGLGTLEHANLPVPERDNAYPENAMFGNTLPAYGLYTRHVRNLTINNFQIKLLSPDARPAMVFEDTHQLIVNQLQADIPVGNQPLIWLNQVSNVTFSGYSSSNPLAVFAKISGAKSSGIRFVNNSITNVKRIFNSSKEVNPKAILTTPNF